MEDPRGSWKDARKRYDGRFMVVDGHARDSMGGNEDVFVEFDGWQVMATKRRIGVDDEERGRAFIGFDDCTVSRGIDERERKERERRGRERGWMQRRDAPWNLTNGKMRRDGYNTSWRRKSERNMGRTRNMTMFTAESIRTEEA